MKCLSLAIALGFVGAFSLSCRQLAPEPPKEESRAEQYAELEMVEGLAFLYGALATQHPHGSKAGCDRLAQYDAFAKLLNANFHPRTFDLLAIDKLEGMADLRKDCQ